MIVAARSSNQRADDASPGAAENTETASPHFQPLTDEQWQRVARIVQPENPAHRGRPSADARTIVNAIRYRAHYGIPWRELPPSFGSWQTVARRYRQLVTDGRWEQIMRMLGET
ncbi:transposase [Georgenia sp. Z1491]|uniref:transposase n=1 Tax=Georgenia sp. Z1491 TaxID=3416707 RepID=UPI003CF9923B